MDSGPGTQPFAAELLIFMLVSYPMHGVDNVDGMRSPRRWGGLDYHGFTRGLGGLMCVLSWPFVWTPQRCEVLCSYPQTDVDQPVSTARRPYSGACQHNHVACVRVLLTPSTDAELPATTMECHFTAPALATSRSLESCWTRAPG